jgi:hypothetical protein
LGIIGFLLFRSGPLISFVQGGMPWGISLTAFVAIILLGVAGEQRAGLAIDFVAKRLGSRKGEVYSHSFAAPADIHFSAKDFYAKIETAVQAKEWPGVELLRITNSETGMLSHKREYLRIIRQRHFFDLCAGTFGQDYFFSIREAEIPAVVSPQAFIALLLLLFGLFAFAVQTMGFLFGPVAFLLFIVFGAFFFMNVVKMGLTKVDAALLQTPIIGPVYEAWVRPDTYFQQDARIVFLHAVNELTKKAVEETVSAKGLKFLDFFEKHPILGELYKRSKTPVEPAKQAEK